MLNIIGDLLLCFEDYKFSKRKKARRKLEKENNLPKKLMIHPFWMIFGILSVIFSVSFFIFFADARKKRTTEKLAEIKLILKKEKSDIGIYPDKLNTIIRNNPLRKDITVDYWKNEFFYEQLEHGQDYILISKGKDGVLNTEDDIN